MREAVLHLSGYNYKSIYGMNYRVKEKITMADLAFRVQHVIKTEVDVTEAQLSRNNIEMLVGIASFVDANHVKVTNSRGTQCLRDEECTDRDGDQACGVGEGADQRAQHYQLRPGARSAEPAEVADRGGWRRDWRGVYVHVLGAGEAY